MNGDARIIPQKLSDEEKRTICESPRLKNVILNASIRETVETHSDSQEDES